MYWERMMSEYIIFWEILRSICSHILISTEKTAMCDKNWIDSWKCKKKGKIIWSLNAPQYIASGGIKIDKDRKIRCRMNKDTVKDLASNLRWK